jgi:undecaprenyl diphosphate synthase
LKELKSISTLEKENIPRHIAIIMDGNGRWAKKQGEFRSFGHQQGVESVRDTVESCVEFGVEYLTLYAFSTENWNRPKEEIAALMSILVNSILNEMPTLMKNGIKLNAIGNLESLPEECLETLNAAIAKTADNTNLTLNLALSYSGRWDIINAVKKIIKDSQSNTIEIESFDDEMFSSYLSTKDIPDPELMIRTSGEFRISNFLLWQIAYTEIFITDILWPDFRKKDLIEAIESFQKRERRFGKTSEQIN